MINTTKLEIIEKLNHLFDLSKINRDDFPNELCNYIADEFKFDGAAIFIYNTPSNIIAIGRSQSLVSFITKNKVYACPECKVQNLKSDFTLLTHPNCKIQITSASEYEVSIIFNISKNQKGLIKLASATPFTSSDSEALHTLVRHFGSLLSLWFEQSKNSSGVFTSKIIDSSSAELKTYINSIIGFTSILADDNLTSTQSEYLFTIKNNAQKLLLNINDINELSKIQNNKIVTKSTDISLNDIVDDVVKLFSQRLLGEGIEFNCNHNVTSNKIIKTDNQKLKFILHTLTSFLSKVTSDKNVKINTALNEDQNIEIELSTSSTILSEEKFSTIFNPFSLTGVNELKNTNLTGLSFVLSKKFAELIGCSLISNISNKIISFKLVFEKNHQKSISSVLGNLPKAGSQNNILVIEDDYATSKLMSNYLTKWGYSPTIVNTDKQVLDLIKKEKYLAIILDIEIPNTNGLELLRKINHNPLSKNTPVIVCSIEADQQKAYLMGAVEYFVKPINYNYLVEILTSYKLRKNSNVLAVDDDLPTLNLVKQAIETAGFNAIAENISANVMDLIEDKNIELAIIDLDMPHPNGFELIKLIKNQKKFSNLPIIIYTGKENFTEDLKQIDGLFEHLLNKKSTNIEDLASTIEAMIYKADVPAAEKDGEKEDVLKILLAEDYKHSQIIVTRLLKKNGFENVVVAENGEDACNLAEKEKFDLILMDMQMPIMNGFEAIGKLRLSPEYKDTPIISLTAFAMKGDREKCLDSGATDYIPKPIDSKEFIEKVKYYTKSLK